MNENKNANHNPCSEVLFFMYNSVKKIGESIAQNTIDAKDSIQEILALSQQLSKHTYMQ